MSLFDPPQRMLNPTLWLGESLRPEVTRHITELLSHVYPLNKVHALVMIGSNVGHLYSSTSDIDICVVGAKGESYDLWHTVFKTFNDTPNFYPGTFHQINFMFNELSSRGDNDDWSNSLGAYDLLSQRWLKRPMPFSALGSLEARHARTIAYGRLLQSMVDAELKAIQSALSLGLVSTARDKIRSLAIFFKSLEDNRKAAYKYGIGTPALQEANILFKLVADSQYAELSHELIKLFDSSWSINE